MADFNSKYTGREVEDILASVAGKANVYTTDFYFSEIQSSSGSINFDSEALADAILANKVIYVPYDRESMGGGFIANGSVDLEDGSMYLSIYGYDNKLYNISTYRDASQIRRSDIFVSDNSDVVTDISKDGDNLKWTKGGKDYLLTVPYATKADSATKLATARTISLSGGATGSASFNGSANASINVTSLDASKVSGTMGSDVYYSHHPEISGGTIIPFLYNDIAHLTGRGGSCKVYITSSTNFSELSLAEDEVLSASTEPLFNAGFNYYIIYNKTASDVYVFDITLPKDFDWACKYYIDFGYEGRRAKDVYFYVYHTDNPTQKYTLAKSITENGKGNFSFSYTYVWTNSDGTTMRTFNRMRVVCTNLANTSQLRIAQIGLISSTSFGHREPYMSRGIDDYLFRSLTPNSNGTYSLGAPTKVWNNVYAKNFVGNIFVGNLQGNSDKSSNSDKLGGIAANKYIYRYDLKYGQSNKIMSLTRGGEKGYIKFYINNSNNTIYEYSSFVIKWNWSSEDAADKPILAYLYEKSKSNTGYLTVVKTSADTYDLYYTFTAPAAYGEVAIESYKTCTFDTTVTALNTADIPEATQSVDVLGKEVGDVIPSETEKFVLGSSTKRWSSVCAKTLYANDIYNVSAIVSSGLFSIVSTNNDIALRRNNDDKTSVILNATSFKPYNSANGLLDLGASGARWKNVYANQFDVEDGKIKSSLGGSTLKVYSVESSYNQSYKETIAIQSVIGSGDPETHQYVDQYTSRCNIALQPRGGQVYIGKYDKEEVQKDYALVVKGGIKTDNFTSQQYWMKEDATLKLYSINTPSSSGEAKETFAIQTCIGGDSWLDPETSSWVSQQEARCNLALQPRGGQVLIGGTSKVIHDKSCSLFVEGGIKTDFLKVQGDSCLKVYSIPSSYEPDTRKETIAFQACYGAEYYIDPETATQVTTNESRCNLALQPRGGQVYIGGYDKELNSNSHSLYVKGGTKVDKIDIIDNGGITGDGIANASLVNEGLSHLKELEAEHVDVYGWIYVDGDIEASGEVIQGSDMRIKNVVEDVLLDIDRVAESPLFKYTLKNDATQRMHIGTSAQYWQGVLPNAVSVTKNDTLALAYDKVALASSITAAKEVVALKKENCELKKQITSLEERLKALEELILNNNNI